MPIDKKTFDLAKDPSPLILAFLEKNPENAYSEKELIQYIPTLRELGFQYSGALKQTLNRLISEGKVDSTFAIKDIFYMITPKKQAQF